MTPLQIITNSALRRLLAGCAIQPSSPESANHCLEREDAAMRAFVFICSGAVALVLGLEFFAPGYGPALLERLLSRPVPQQFPRTVVCVVALVLLGAAL